MLAPLMGPSHNPVGEVLIIVATMLVLVVFFASIAARWLAPKLRIPLTTATWTIRAAAMAAQAIAVFAAWLTGVTNVWSYVALAYVTGLALYGCYRFALGMVSAREEEL
jgi:hypothetical protein